MKIRRIAIIFDNTVRSDTTGTHCLRALEELVARGELDAVTHVLPAELERLAGMPVDLYLVIDDGLGCVLPAEYRPAAYWTIDTHLGFEERLAFAQRFDFVFAAQKRGARELAERGISSARWLPLAANPAVHRKHDVGKRYDFVFVGNLFPGPRSEIVGLAQQYYRNSFVGRAYGDDMARTLSEGRAALNPSVGDDVNMRFFEVPACGTFQLANALPQSGQAELLQPGKHFESYTSGAEMLDKLKFYLAREELRERIAAEGRAEVLARHTYLHRMREMLELVIGHSSLVIGNGRAAPSVPRSGIRQNSEEIPVAEFARIPESGGTPRTLASPATSQSGIPNRQSHPSPTPVAEFVRIPECEAGDTPRTLASPATSQSGIPNRQSHPSRTPVAEFVRIPECEAGDTPRTLASPATSNPKSEIRNSQLPDFSYYGFSRPELLAHVPSWVRRALDLGCGAGAWGASLKARQPCHVTGVELCPEAAEAARRVLDEVLLADVEAFDPPWTDGAFDHVNIGDALEHCRDPQRVLEEARHWLADKGQLVASIPNSRHHSLVASLVAGNWTYEPSGLLDATHLRFFTRREIEKLFYRSGYDVLKVEPVYAPGADAVRDASPPGELRAGRLRLEGLTEADVDEFFAYQYLVKAKPARRARRELTSIVFVTFNGLAFTQQFLESVRFHTDGRPEFGTPYELIGIDNGSSDGTREFLERQADVTLIANAENRGFPAAANQGFRASRGRQVLFINNDVLVTTGWLDRMLTALDEAPRSGIRENSDAATSAQAAANGAIAKCELTDAQRPTPNASFPGSSDLVRTA